MEDEVVGRVVEDRLDLLKHLLQDLCEILQQIGSDFSEICRVSLGKNPELEWEPGGKRGKADHLRCFHHQALSFGEFLMDDVAKDASLLLIEVKIGPFQFLHDPFGDDGECNELSVGMAQGGSRGFSKVLKDQQVTESFILL